MQPHAPRSAGKRIAILSTLLLFVALIAGSGMAVAHNPACQQTAEQGDLGNSQPSPHYAGGQSSDAANTNNPTIEGDEPGNYPGSCSKGNSQAPHNDYDNEE